MVEANQRWVNTHAHPCRDGSAGTAIELRVGPPKRTRCSVIRGLCRIVLLAGARDGPGTWDEFRSALGPDVWTCAWDYPGVGQSTGTPPMTAGIASASLNQTLWQAGVRPPFVLVGHSIAGLTVRLFVGQHPEDVAGVVLFD